MCFDNFIHLHNYILITSLSYCSPTPIYSLLPLKNLEELKGENWA